MNPRAELELRGSRKRYRQIIETVFTVFEGVWTIDAGAITTYVSQQMASMLGRNAADMLRRSIYDFMQQDTRVEVERTFERVRDGLAQQRDVRFQRADGTDLWAIVSIYPIFGEGEEFVGALVPVTDITERRQRERAEREAEMLRIVAALAAATSHEINNPLMAVMGNLELLERTHRLDAYGRARLEVALAAAGVIKETVRRFGRITRLEIADHGPDLPPRLDLEKSSQGLADGR